MVLIRLAYSWGPRNRLTAVQLPVFNLKYSSSSSRIERTLAVISSSEAHRYPLTLSKTALPNPPTRAATTGVPRTAASAAASPNPSYLDGHTSTRVCAMYGNGLSTCPSMLTFWERPALSLAVQILERRGPLPRTTALTLGNRDRTRLTMRMNIVGSFGSAKRPTNRRSDSGLLPC